MNAKNPNNAIPQDVFEHIQARLKRIEKEHEVRVLLAIESGSRAWGFASPDSDYDIRFIYAHPKDWYLSIDLEEKRDVIEYPIVDDIDINGWDVRKALSLFKKSNPAFIEWIQSPILYQEQGTFKGQCLEALPTVYQPARGMHHYLNMANNHYRTYLKKEAVLLKKYFYALRPILAVHWIEQHGTPPPIEFSRLLNNANPSSQLAADIKHLLEQKKHTSELGTANPIISLNQFISTEIERISQITTDDSVNSEAITVLNNVFHQILSEA